jgi:hypothetical protein
MKILCDHCEEPLRRGKACLVVYYKDILHVEAAMALRNASHPVNEDGLTVVTGKGMGELPDDAPWYWEHDACSGEGDGYWIEVSRIRTSAKALGWTLHLMGKTWFQHTAWQAAMGRAKLVVYG